MPEIRTVRTLAELDYQWAWSIIRRIESGEIETFDKYDRLKNFHSYVAAYQSWAARNAGN